MTRFWHDHVLNCLSYHDVANATVTRGAAGFGAEHRMEMARFVETSLNLPVKIEFIEARAKAEEILPKLLEIVEEGLVEIQDTTIVKPGGSEARAPIAISDVEVIRYAHRAAPGSGG